MGQVDIGGIMYDIYGTYDVDDPGPPIVPSAVTYFGGQLNTTAWDDAVPDDQKKSLVTAGRIFDKQLWLGTVTDPTTPQPLAWPRTGVPPCLGITVDPNLIPENVVFGSYEYALAILQDAATQSEANTGSNVKRELDRQKVGDLEVELEKEYFSATNSGPRAAPRFPTPTQEYIRCFLASGGVNALAVGTAPSVTNTACFDFGVKAPGTL